MLSKAQTTEVLWSVIDQASAAGVRAHGHDEDDPIAVLMFIAEAVAAAALAADTVAAEDGKRAGPAQGLVPLWQAAGDWDLPHALQRHGSAVRMFGARLDEIEQEIGRTEVPDDLRGLDL